MKTKCKSLEYIMYYTYELSKYKFKIRNNTLRYYKHRDRKWIYILLLDDIPAINAYSVKGLLYKALNGIYQMPANICIELRHSNPKLPINIIATVWLKVTQINEKEVDTLLIPALKNAGKLEYTLKEVVNITTNIIGNKDFTNFINTGEIKWTREQLLQNENNIYDPITKRKNNENN